MPWKTLEENNKERVKRDFKIWLRFPIWFSTEIVRLGSSKARVTPVSGDEKILRQDTMLGRQGGESRGRRGKSVNFYEDEKHVDTMVGVSLCRLNYLGMEHK